MATVSSEPDSPTAAPAVSGAGLAAGAFRAGAGPDRRAGRDGGRGGRTGRAPRIGFGGGGMDSPIMGARAGMLPAASRAFRTVSPEGSSGRPSGWIWRRIGEAAAGRAKLANVRLEWLSVIAAPGARGQLLDQTRGIWPSVRVAGPKSAAPAGPGLLRGGASVFPMGAELLQAPVELLAKLAVEFAGRLVSRRR